MFGQDLHAKRIISLAGATLGAIESASLAIALIGQGLALARGLKTKYAIKQVDRMLANMAIDVDALLRHWVRFVAGQRPSLTVAIDWTEFEADGQATLMLSMLTRHGRATPLYWLTVDKATLKNRRNGYEYQALVRLAEALPDGVKVCIVADRGFGFLKAPVKRVTVPNVCIPYAPNAEARVIPNAESIARTVRELTGRAAAA